MYYASDGPQFGGAPPRAVWKHFRKNMPLTDDELRIIANNVAPFVDSTRDENPRGPEEAAHAQ